MNTRSLVFLLGLAAAAWAFRRWRPAIQAAMVLVVVEGAIRKWLLPGAQDLVYFGKDVLLIGAYAGFLAEERSRRMAPPIPPAMTALAIAGAAFGLFQVLNPNLPTVLLGAIGWKAYFLYVPLLWVLPAALPTDQAVGAFLRRHLYLTIPVGLLAIAQFFSPPDSQLNMYARSGTQQWVTTFGSSSFVRVTGTFSYITGFSAYLLASALLLLGVLGSSGLRLRNRMWAVAALALTLAGMLMTGSRGPVFFLIVVLPVYWLLAFARLPDSVALSAKLAAGLVVLATAVYYLAPDARNAFLERARSGGDTAGRFSEPLLSPIRAFSDAGILGLGIGATHQAASAVVRFAGPPYWLRGNYIEADPGRVMLEMGPIGFLLVYGFRVLLLATLLRSVIAQRSLFRLGIAAACFSYVLSQSLGAVYDPTSSLYYWFISSLATALWSIDLREKAAARSGQPAARQPATRPAPAAG